MTYCDGIMQVHNEEKCRKMTGAGSSHSGGAQPGSVMDEEWGMSPGSEYAPSETGHSTENTVSMVNKSCEAVGGSSSEGDDAEEVHADSAEGSGKGKSRKRRREPTVEGRRWRQKAAGDGFMFDKKGSGLRGVVPRELTATPVKAWVPQRKAFRLAGRLIPFSVYNVTLFISLPVTGKIVEFGEDDLSTTKLARMKYMEDVHGMDEYAWAKAVWHVLIEAIEEMQWKLEGPVFDVRFDKHITRFAQHDKCRFPQLASRDSVDHGGRYNAFQLVEGIKESKEEMLVPTVRAFMKTDGFRDYILDGELEARLKMYAAPSEAQDIGHQPGGDVGEDVQSDNGLESLARAVTNLGEATTHELSAVKGGEEDATCQTTADILGLYTCRDGWGGAPLGESVQRVTTPEEDAQITGEAERTSPDADDVGCEDDGGEKSSNIVARMRRKPRCRKLAAVYGSPFTDQTRLPSARKSKKERNEGMTGADEACAVDDPGERSVHSSTLDVHPLLVEGSGIGPSVEELNKLKLMK
ncbi:hypothetical protein Cgig2_002663 [Carnegiea gigantea]|uniref:Uncharacterized protein n=1 Tax=Carnegiea gigantea TaxID=171969 RepID=A0A9Q1QBU8_9CARY|nr:hypothetical protein Cgig2_002663 [Carnegiea gigantea]